MIIHEQLETPVVDSADVLVLGGGIAGVAAALAARRLGTDVLLIEKSALFGGLATGGLISWYEPLCDGHGTVLMHGLAEELMYAAIHYGPDTLPKVWQDKEKAPDPALLSTNKFDAIGGRKATYYSPTLFQLALDELLEKAGVRLRLSMAGVRPLMEGTSCRGVITESLSGRGAFLGRMVIDTTGDAVLLSRAGVPTCTGENYFTYIAHEMHADANGPMLRNRTWHTVGANLFGQGHPDQDRLFTGTNNEEETEFMLLGRRRLLDEIRQREPDRTHFDVTALPTQAQFRKTRRLDSPCTLTEKDCRQYHVRSVSLLSDFYRPGDWYELPYETLYHPDYPNLLCAGRMIASSGWAWEVTRVIPSCAASGQAAGTAAALALQKDCSTKEVPIEILQTSLCKQGVLLHRAEAD